MKVIDLLNKIANGEELPKKVIYEGIIFENKDEDLLNSNNYSLFEHRNNASEKLLPMLNDEVEIIEEPRNIEVCGSLFTKSEYDELAKSNEDNKIEKFKVIKDNSGDSVQLVYDDMNLNLTLLQAIILDKVNEVIEKVNGDK